jgi:hypothetical protein
MKTKRASVVKVAGLSCVPLLLVGVGAKVGEQRKAKAAQSELFALARSEDDGLSSSKLEELIARGADVNAQSPSTMPHTALLYAVQAGNSNAVRLLLNRGARLNERTRIDDWTGMLRLRGRSHNLRAVHDRKIVQMLKAAGAKE